MIKILLSFLLLCLIQSGHAQVVYTGHVTDVGTSHDIEGVRIEWKNTGLSTLTNAFGDFAFYASDLNAETTPSYFFSTNALFWTDQQHFHLKIFQLNGTNVYDQTFSGQNGNHLLPRLNRGLYILWLQSNCGIASYKLWSDGEQTKIADKHVAFYERKASAVLDTLVFTKAGFHPREIAMTHSHLEVPMLSTAEQSVDYFNELIHPLAFDLLSSAPSRSNVGEVKSVKFIYDFQEDVMYYMNSKKFALHFDFAVEVLGYNRGLYAFNTTQYAPHSERYMNLGSLNYYESQDRYVLQLVALTQLDCSELKRLFDKIASTSFIGDDLFFYAIKPEWDNCTGVQQVSSEELFEGQNYQALNLTEGYGYLHKVELDDLPNTYLSRQDIVLLDDIPNDLSVVAGIITTEFQTPLSHINVLSHSRDTPNMALRDGWTNSLLKDLIGELVYLNVTAETFEIRKATLDEANAFWEIRTPQVPVTLEKDTEFDELIDMADANFSFLSKTGGKAANFAELMNVRFHGNPIPVPEGAFAIPFHYYQKHLEQNGLSDEIENMLNDSQFQSDPEYRKTALEELQNIIIDAPISPQLLDLVNQKINFFQDFESIRFRSSTNAEDLETFSGAGLYDSYSAKKNHNTKTVENAIKKVWASLWNWRAFEERSYFKIDHLSCAMGVLVHRSFPDEDANGVLITKNLYNFNPGFIVNVQFGEESIVFPEPGVIHDQIILYEYPTNPTQPFLIEYLTFSNLPEASKGTVMSDDELIELANYSMEVKKHFYYNVPHQCQCSFKNFGVDIEFKVDSEVENRKVYIKQARLYR